MADFFSVGVPGVRRVQPSQPQLLGCVSHHLGLERFGWVGGWGEEGGEVVAMVIVGLSS